MRADRVGTIYDVFFERISAHVEGVSGGVSPNDRATPAIHETLAQFLQA